jgi:hypothetical protein
LELAISSPYTGMMVLGLPFGFSEYFKPKASNEV